MQHELAVIAGLPHEAIRLVFIEGAGCYGRNGTEDAAADAPLIAMTIGQPVRVHGRWRMKPHTLPRVRHELSLPSPIASPTPPRNPRSSSSP